MISVAAPPKTGVDATVAGWSHFPHSADIGLSGHGPSLASAFEQVALALTALITDQRVATRVPINVACEAPAPN